MKRFRLFSANYGELLQYTHTQTLTLVPSVAALTHSDVMKAICCDRQRECFQCACVCVCMLGLLCQPQCCVICWPMFAFISGSKCGPVSAPVSSSVCVCVNCPTCEGVQSQLCGVYGPQSCCWQTHIGFHNIISEIWKHIFLVCSWWEPALDIHVFWD